MKSSVVVDMALQIAPKSATLLWAADSEGNIQNQPESEGVYSIHSHQLLLWHTITL